jgi:hypothetical protein
MAILGLFGKSYSTQWKIFSFHEHVYTALEFEPNQFLLKIYEEKSPHPFLIRYYLFNMYRKYQYVSNFLDLRECEFDHQKWSVADILGISTCNYRIIMIANGHVPESPREIYFDWISV